MQDNNEMPVCEKSKTRDLYVSYWNNPEVALQHLDLGCKIPIPEVGPKFTRDRGDIRGKAGRREFSLLVDAVSLRAQAAPL